MSSTMIQISNITGYEHIALIASDLVEANLSFPQLNWTIPYITFWTGFDGHYYFLTLIYALFVTSYMLIVLVGGVGKQPKLCVIVFLFILVVTTSMATHASARYFFPLLFISHVYYFRSSVFLSVFGIGFLLGLGDLMINSVEGFKWYFN